MRRLTDAEEEDEDDRGRHGREAEHEPPRLDEREAPAHEVAGDDADDRRHLVGDEEAAADLRRGGLGDEDGDDGQGDADGHAEEEPGDEQREVAGGDAGDDREDDVAAGDEEHRLLAPDRVRQRTADDRADDLPDDDRGGESAELGGIQSEVALDEEEGAGDVRDVVSVRDAEGDGGECDDGDEPRCLPQVGEKCHVTAPLRVFLL
ncbi:Uncharacterised protein [Mycobacteroides abscessus subsp. abscessus]|nr:Uncharacterised protein [Mycobacteroides abscessus subsp. abscessus]